MKKSFWFFQNGRFFNIAYFFLAKQRFCKYQLILWPDFKKKFFIWKLFWCRRYPRKTHTSKTGRCIFLLLTVSRQICFQSFTLQVTRFWYLSRFPDSLQKKSYRQVLSLLWSAPVKINPWQHRILHVDSFFLQHSTKKL